MTRPVFDAHTSGGNSFGALPEWDLSDLYASPDASELKRDLEWVDTACAGFAQAYESKLATLDAAGLLTAVQTYERIGTVVGRIMSYAGLRYYQMTTDSERAKFMADCQDQITTATTFMVFYDLEFNRLDEGHLARRLADNADLARYKPVFDRMRAMKPYQLSDELEKFLHDQSTVGAAAWNRLFDETIAGLTFTVNGEELSIEGVLNLMTEQDRSVREAAVHALANVFQANLKTFSRIPNTLAKEKEIEDRWRGMPTPQTGRHLSNHVEPEVVEALRNAVVAAYPRLSHRYYRL